MYRIVGSFHLLNRLVKNGSNSGCGIYSTTSSSPSLSITTDRLYTTSSSSSDNSSSGTGNSNNINTRNINANNRASKSRIIDEDILTQLLSDYQGYFKENNLQAPTPTLPPRDTIDNSNNDDNKPLLDTDSYDINMYLNDKISEYYDKNIADNDIDQINFIRANRNNNNSKKSSTIGSPSSDTQDIKNKKVKPLKYKDNVNSSRETKSHKIESKILPRSQINVKPFIQNLDLPSKYPKMDKKSSLIDIFKSINHLDEYSKCCFFINNLNNREDTKPVLEELVLQDISYYPTLILYYALEEKFTSGSTIIESMTSSVINDTNNPFGICIMHLVHKMKIALIAGAIVTKNYTLVGEMMTKYQMHNLKESMFDIYQILHYGNHYLPLYVMYLHQQNIQIHQLLPLDMFLDSIYAIINLKPIAAIKWVDAMLLCGYDIDEEMYLDIHNILSSLEHNSIALSFRDNLSAKGYHPTETIITNSFLVLSLTTDVEELLSLYNNIEKYDVGQQVHDTMVATLLSHLTYSTNFHRLSKFLYKADSILSKHPSINIYHSLLTHYHSNQKMVKVLFEKLLKERSIEPDLSTIQILLDPLLKDNVRPKKALHTSLWLKSPIIKFTQADGLGMEVSHEDQDNNEQEETTTDPKLLQECMDLLHSIPIKDAKYYNFILLLSLKSVTPKSPLSILSEMLSKGFLPTSQVLTNLIKSLPSIDWIKICQQNNIPIDSTNFHIFLKHKSANFIESFYQDLKKSFPIMPETFQFLANTFLYLGKLDKVHRLIVSELGPLDDKEKANAITSLLINANNNIPLGEDDIKLLYQQIPDKAYHFAQCALNNKLYSIAWTIINSLPKHDEKTNEIVANYVYLYLLSNNTNIDVNDLLGKLSIAHLNNPMIRHSFMLAIHHNRSNYYNENGNFVPLPHSTFQLFLNHLHNLGIQLKTYELVLCGIIECVHSPRKKTKDFIMSSVANRIKGRTLDLLSTKLLVFNTAPLGIDHWIDNNLKYLSHDEVEKLMLKMLSNRKTLSHKTANQLLHRIVTSDPMYIMLFHYFNTQSISNAALCILDMHDPINQQHYLEIFINKHCKDQNYFTVYEHFEQSPNFDQKALEKFIELAAPLYPHFVLPLNEYLAFSTRYKYTISLTDSMATALAYYKRLSPDLYESIGLEPTSGFYVAMIKSLQQNRSLNYDNFIDIINQADERKLTFTSQDFFNIMMILSESPFTHNKKIFTFLLDFVGKEPYANEIFATLGKQLLTFIQKKVESKSLWTPLLFHEIINKYNDDKYSSSKYISLFIDWYPQYYNPQDFNIVTNEIKMKLRRHEFNQLGDV
ncbi:hypothetical protein CYY_007095 [Polysphondylium violaceum]|uniref:Uncharacterized protein n=1 Tax=Polysphondylium violaceum TaxID=133409 RepID=A0A8J4PRA3_9MYCE|nr:hypothetical protein CYY_007095 [Polysphondylium violaceum]